MIILTLNRHKFDLSGIIADMKNISPISLSTFDEMLTRWSEIARRNESGIMYWYNSSDLRFRHAQLHNSKDLAEERFLQFRIQVVIVDFVHERIETQDDLELLYKQLRVQFGSDCTLLMLCIEIDSVIRERNSNLLSGLSRLALLPSCSVLLFTSINFNSRDVQAFLAPYIPLLNNVHLQPLYSESDSLQFISYLEEKWNCKINNELKKRIVSQCGGYLWLVKHAVRELIFSNNKRLDDVWDSVGMRFKIETIWNRFSKDCQQALKTVVCDGRFGSDVSRSVETFLLQSGWVNSTASGCSVSIPLIESYIRMARSVVMEIIDGRIVCNGIELTSNFSTKEYRFLSSLLINPGAIVSREKMGSIIWEGGDEYSDWALDQLVARTRKKLRQMGVDNVEIVVKKKLGFCLRPMRYG